jgi:hypothetical protein
MRRRLDVVSICGTLRIATHLNIGPCSGCRRIIGDRLVGQPRTSRGTRRM